MKAQIQVAKEIVKHKEINKIGDKIWEVRNHSVILNSKKGRKVLICDCENSGRFNHDNLCYHKLAVILFEADNEFYKKVDKLISDYKQVQDIKGMINPYCMINDLENLRRIK